ncbi:MAG: PrsW family glutamic-type intramembrane protease [Bacteroidia bacterium]
MPYHIERNGQQHGPYELDALKKYVEDGLILLQDKIHDPKGAPLSVRDVLKSNGINVKVKNNGNVLSQIKSFGTKLLIPKDSLSFKNLKSDKRLLVIALVGLAPAFLIRFTGASVITFYAIALYFSMIWGLFYYSVFSTSQVVIKKAIGLFFLTQLVIFILVDIFQIPSLHPLYALTNENNGFLSRLIGFTFGVGVFEEFVKLLPVYLLLRKSKEPLIPQTVVFYGLMSGIGFGVFEGVVYQLTVNNQLDYGTSFFMNIARLTCLPFLHSIWAGISSYFLAFSFLYPKNRHSMWLLGILIPAILHGLYDTLGWSILGLLVSYMGVTLLVIYLKNAKDFQSKIIK